MYNVVFLKCLWFWSGRSLMHILLCSSFATLISCYHYVNETWGRTNQESLASCFSNMKISNFFLKLCFRISLKDTQVTGNSSFN